MREVRGSKDKYINLSIEGRGRCEKGGCAGGGEGCEGRGRCGKGGVGREGVREEVSRHCKSSEMVSLAAHFVFTTALSDQTNSACVWLKLLFCQFNWLCTNNWSK